MKEELEETILALDTWNREVQLPPFYFTYFMETFMISAYTCDQLSAPENQYPGFAKTMSCWCNNGDYHSMPTINFEL